MYVEKLTLKNFRNYVEQEFIFNEGINILYGANAQGKTNVAEAIYYLCTGYSPRANKDKLAVRFGEESADICAYAKSTYGDIKTRVLINKNDKKRVFVNGMEILKIGEFLGNIRSVFFNPQDLKLVQESPEDRRKFMNVSLCQLSKSYFYALARYNKILSQRNNLLKNPDVALIKETLSIWDVQLSREAGKIIKMRNDFLSELSPVAQEKHSLLTGNGEILSMKTEDGYFGSEEDIAYSIKSDLKTAFEKDLRLKYTSIGPHRDDIRFTVNGEDVRVFGSQGQQRTVALSLKLAETELFKARCGEYPVLILDDVLSELDKQRQKRLISAVDKLQTIFTCAVFEKTPFKKTLYKKFTIDNGKLKSTFVNKI